MNDIHYLMFWKKHTDRKNFKHNLIQTVVKYKLCIVFSILFPLGLRVILMLEFLAVHTVSSQEHTLPCSFSKREQVTS